MINVNSAIWQLYQDDVNFQWDYDEVHFVLDQHDNHNITDEVSWLSTDISCLGGVFFENYGYGVQQYFSFFYVSNFKIYIWVTSL